MGSTVKLRLISAAVFGLCLGWLVYAAGLAPDAQGLGTHRQMGLAACSWVEGDRGPCPTCGMTTAFAHAARGNLPRAFATQPASALLALLTAMTVWVSGYTMCTGCTEVRRLGGLVRWRTLGVVLAVALAAWVYTRWIHGSLL